MTLTNPAMSNRHLFRPPSAHWKSAAVIPSRCPGGHCTNSIRYPSGSVSLRRLRLARRMARQSHIPFPSGRALGVTVGLVSPAVHSTTEGWAVDVPPLAWVRGVPNARPRRDRRWLLPAMGTARMPPTQALWSVSFAKHCARCAHNPEMRSRTRDAARLHDDAESAATPLTHDMKRHHPRSRFTTNKL